MDKTTLFEQIAVEHDQFWALTEQWKGRWTEAPQDERKLWTGLFRSLMDRMKLYDDLLMLEKRRLQFVAGSVSGLVGSVGEEGTPELAETQIAEFKEHLKTGDQPARMRAAGLGGGGE